MRLYQRSLLPKVGTGITCYPQPDHKVYRMFIVIRPKRMWLPSNGNPCNEGFKLVHSALQCARDDLLGGNDIYDSSPARVSVPVNRVEQCLANCLK